MKQWKQNQKNADRKMEGQKNEDQKNGNQKKQRRWISGSLVAGLAVAAVVSGSGDVTGAYPVKKSGFQMTEYMADGVGILTAYAVGDNVQVIDQASTSAVSQNVAVGSQTSQTGQSDQTSQTGQSGQTSGTGQSDQASQISQPAASTGIESATNVTGSNGAGSGASASGSTMATAGSNSTVTAGSSSAPTDHASVGSSTTTAGSSTATAGSSTATVGSSTVTAGSSTATVGSSTVTAGSSNVVTAGSGTITAGGGTGPSVYGTIVTEGEKTQQGGVIPQEAILGGATLTMLNSQSSSQMLSMILQTSQGSLIVVDGGLGADGDYLRSQIQARGGHVAAWLITHPHGDHVGALYKILQDEAAGIASGITIDGIYYSFAAPEWYTVHDPDEVTMAHSIIGTFAGLPQDMLHTVGRGQTFQVDDVTVQVMNDRYEVGSDKGNNAGIVYKLYVNGKSILVLGDMAYEGGNRLLADVGADALRSDIVQVAHHGQNGVGEEFYQAVNPSICLWPTPQWLWNNEGNKYKTPETKGWLSRLNVEKHYCMKDGDQVIR